MVSAMAVNAGCHGSRYILMATSVQKRIPPGEFEFERVGAGEHWLRIAVEEAPLPFGLEDESPRSLIVPIRGIGRLDFGLVEIE